MKTVISTLLVIALLAAAIIGMVIVTGSYNFAADEPHWSVTEKIISSARHRSIDLRAEHIPVPNDLDDPQRIHRGAEHYQAMCVGCHLAPGIEESELREGMYPRPPALAEHGIHDPKGAYWVIKHGIKMSGMPAWGKSHDEQSLWDMVALLSALPSLSESDWQALLGDSDRPPTGHDHGSSGHGGAGHHH